MFQTLSTPPGEPWVADSTQREVREVPKDREKKKTCGLEEHLSSVREWQQDETKALWPASDTTVLSGSMPAPHERSRCSSFFFRLEATVLINNLSHTTTNPRVNAGNTSLFPSLSFYHKHINISLTRVLRCTARPAGSQQAASTLCAQKAMLKCEAVSRSYRQIDESVCVCVRSGMSVYTWCAHRFL